MLFQSIFTQKRAGDVEKIGIIKEFDKLGRLVIKEQHPTCRRCCFLLISKINFRLGIFYIPSG